MVHKGGPSRLGPPLQIYLSGPKRGAQNNKEQFLQDPVAPTLPRAGTAHTAEGHFQLTRHIGLGAPRWAQNLIVK